MNTMRVAAMAVAMLLAGCMDGITDPFGGPTGTTEWVPGEGDHAVHWSIATSGSLPPESEEFFDGGDIIVEIRGIQAPIVAGVYDKDVPVTISRELNLAIKWTTYWSVTIHGVEVSKWLLSVNGEAPEATTLLDGREWASFQLSLDGQERPNAIDWIGNDIAEIGMFKVWCDSVTTIPDCENFPNPHDAVGDMVLWTPSHEVPMKRLDGVWAAYVVFRAGVMRVTPHDDWYQKYLVGTYATPLQGDAQELWYATTNEELFGDWLFQRAYVTPRTVTVPEEPNTCGQVN